MTPPSDSEVIAWLASALNPQEPYHLKIISSVRHPSSVSWAVGIGEGGVSKSIFIKHQKEDLMYEREKKVLVHLRPYADENERYAVPHILAWNDQLRVIALKWLEGEPVARKLRAAVARLGNQDDLARGLSLVHEVGRWLHYFERRTSSGKQGTFPSDAIMRRISELNTFIQSKGLRGFDEAFAKTIENHVTHNLGRINGNWEFSCLQRDFWFGHIWEKTNGIVVIDFGRCIEGPRGRDAAQFYLRLSDFAILNPLVSGRKVGLLQAEFVRGYGSFDIHDPAIIAYMILAKLELLGGIVEQKYAGLLARSVARLHVRAHVRWLAQAVCSLGDCN
ncbi:MAG: hypothetical protein ACREOO_25465 [bacterium]